MGRRKIVRSLEEEEEYQKCKREKAALYQRKFREKKKLETAKLDKENIPSSSKVWVKDLSITGPGTSKSGQIASGSQEAYPVITRTPAPTIIKNVYGASAVAKRTITNSTIIRSVALNEELSKVSHSGDKSTAISVPTHEKRRAVVDVTLLPTKKARIGYCDISNPSPLKKIRDNNTKKQDNLSEMKDILFNVPVILKIQQIHETNPPLAQKSRIENYDVPNTSIEVINNNATEQEIPFEIQTKNLADSSRRKNKNHNARIKGFENINSNEVNEHYIGTMDIVCQYCNAKHFKAETINNKKNSFSDCCSHGKVKLNPLPPLPKVIEQLFTGNHEKSNDFLKNIRAYNSSHSFASFNANLVNLNSHRRGPPCFKICGQIYYKINTALYPPEKSAASYGQLFILDPNEAIQNRSNANSHLDVELLEMLDNVIRNNNIFAKSFQMMHEEVQNQEQLGSNIPDLSMAFINNKTGIDRGRYNSQRINEVAAIFSTTADGEIPDTCVTIINKHDRSLRNVTIMDPNVEPWIYPLFYPYGTQGWHVDLKQINGKRVSRSMYVQWHLSIRDELNVFLHGRRLLQQWLVDSYVKVEKDRITWCKDNQKQLRVEQYQGLIDHMTKSAAAVPNSKVGKIIILPSSFTGSPRNMMQNYQDAMAIVRKHGKPDLFITMTCNPNWTEINENLLPGQQPADRPDICARVFDIKKNYLLDVIRRQNFFGEVQAYVYVIEFQKRGLPHMHLLVTLKHKNKIDSPELVDKYISAEIPDPVTDPTLHAIVMNNMIHGPCGDWCIVKGKCSKHFPKSFNNETTMDENGYPNYRRKDTGHMYKKSHNFTVDNRYVVPHCPKLMKLLNCHINVEIVSSIKSVKYVYKYIFKGHDKASVVIGENVNSTTIVHDEIHDFVEARYVAPVEAYMRIVGKHLQDKSHAIIRLPVHLPKGQNIVISNGMSAQDLQSALERTTMLVEYFELNKRDVDARKYTYAEIPSHYVFKNKHWEKRQTRFDCIGRMYSVSPTEIELFHLRILLLNVKGATSFEDLRTVNGVLNENFTSTCLALGLIEDDNEWKQAMNEAVVWMMPRRLRLLFVRILMHCQPVHPKELWEEFQIPMSEDFIRKFGNNVGITKAYTEIDRLLQREGWNISKFPEMDQITTELRNEIDDVTQSEVLLRGQTQYSQLNGEQKHIVDYIISLVQTEDNSNQAKSLYIDGPGGTGKTFVYTTLYNLLTGHGKTVNTMAFTGIAATLLPNGKTVHKTLGLPVPLYPDSTSNIKAQSKQAEQLRNTDVFIWDEAPMAPRYALEVMNHLLKDLMGNNEPFGGKIVILGGDFRQLLPIKKGATRNETVNLSIKNSLLWSNFKMFSLKENMRVLENEQGFAKFLLDLGDGILNDSSDNIEIPQRFLADFNVDIVKDTYKELIENKKYRFAAKRAILSARNADVNSLNEKVIDLLDENSERHYTSIDSAETTNDDHDINQTLLPEYLNTLNPPSLPPHMLRLRKFAVVMLIRNLNISEGLCNGTRLMVLELGNNLLKCEILTGDKMGDTVFLNRITLNVEDIYPFVFKRRQFPIKLAFAMTINKAQGQTFEKISIDLSKDIFSHGQLYVAFSRVKSWDSLKIFTKSDRQDNYTKNYVYREIFD